MNFQSNAFESGAPIPSEYTCDGKNISPAFSVENVPTGTKSLTLIMNDPDAPGGAWVHWTMWNIPPETRLFVEGNVPLGVVEGTTSFGTKGYGGPCPPRGTHRYMFHLYALDIPLNIPLTSRIADIKEAMKGHILGDDTLMGTYTKN